MASALPGAILLLAVATLGLCAWRASAVAHYGRALTCIVALGLLLRSFAAADLVLHPWDERFHAVVAKNLARHPLVPTLYDDPALPYDATNWGATHIWLHKPPFALWLIAASVRTFGVHEYAVRLPSLILSGLGIALTYLLGSWFFDRRVGLLAAFLQAVNGFLVELAAGRVATDHVDATYFALVELALALLCLHTRRGGRLWYLPALAGLVTGLGLLTKWLPALLVLPVWLALAWRRHDRFRATLDAGVVLAVALVVALPWRLYTHRAFAQEAAWEESYNLRHLFETLEGHGHSALYFLAGLPRTYGEVAYVALVWLLWRAWRRGTDRAPRLLAVWIGLPYVVFSLCATKMASYVMVAAPAVFLAIAAFWWHLRDSLAQTRSRVASVILLTLLIALPLRYSVERVKPLAGIAQQPVWVKALRELGQRASAERAVLFNVEQPVEAMFYTPWPAYSSIPSPQQVHELTARGYHVLVVDDGNVPLMIARHPDVRLVRLQPSEARD